MHWISKHCICSHWKIVTSPGISNLYTWNLLGLWQLCPTFLLFQKCVMEGQRNLCSLATGCLNTHTREASFPLHILLFFSFPLRIVFWSYLVVSLNSKETRNDIWDSVREYGIEGRPLRIVSGDIWTQLWPQPDR